MLGLDKRISHPAITRIAVGRVHNEFESGGKHGGTPAPAAQLARSEAIRQMQAQRRAGEADVQGRPQETISCPYGLRPLLATDLHLADSNLRVVAANPNTTKRMARAVLLAVGRRPAVARTAPLCRVHTKQSGLK